SHRIVYDDLRLAGWPTDNLRAKPVRAWPEGWHRAKARHRARERPRDQHVCRRGVRIEGAGIPTHGARGACGEATPATSEIGRDTRSGIYDPDVSRGNPPPHPYWRRAEWANQKLWPRRLGDHLAAGRLFGCRGRGQRTAVRFRHGQDQG